MISLKWSFLKSNWGAISPTANIDEPIAMSLEDFQYAFASGLPAEFQRASYERYVVPESRRVGKGPTTDTAAIDFKRPRPPLLLIAGTEDHIIPASLNRDNFYAYRLTPAVTDFREFSDRTHLSIAQDGWREVADYVLAWIQKNQS